MAKEITIENGKVLRRYTAEWSKSGFINLDKLPQIIESVIVQRTEMIKYVEALHDKLDEIIEKNNLCDICLTANCGSDHK